MQQAMNELKQAVQEARNELNDKMDEMEINLGYEINAIKEAIGSAPSADDGEE
tara:strand:+ start:10144 stop:10302 length:159 start_codon:yes stop_codon:yes gene_type:complete